MGFKLRSLGLSCLVFPHGVRKNLLFLNGSTYGTSVSACTALDAFISIYNVLAVAFGNAGNRASVSASAARDALIGNFVCHWLIPPKYCLFYCIIFS